MVIRESLPFTPLPYAAPRAASAAPSSEPDQVQLSGATPAGNPWPALEKAGVLVAGGAVGGPIGEALRETARTELGEAIERLQSKGVKVEYRRKFHLWKLRPKYEELSPEKTLKHILEKKPDELTRLEITTPGAERRPVVDLLDLRLADGLFGAGPTSLSAEDQESLASLKNLIGAGAKLSSNRYYYDDERPPIDEMQALRWLNRGDRLDFTLAGESISTYGREQLAAADFFYAAGSEKALKNPRLGKRLKKASEAGFKFYSERRETKPYHVYNDPKSLSVSKDGSPMLAIKAEDLDALPDLEARLSELKTTFDEILKAPYEKMGWTGTQSFPASVLDQSGKFTLRVASAVFAELVRSAATGGDDRYDAYSRVDKLFQDLCASSKSPYELARKTQLVAESYAKGGHQAARASMDETRKIVESRAHTPERQSEIEDLFFKLLESTGSVSCAAEGLDLVRIRLGNESEDERVKLFRELAARQSESTLPETAAYYRAVMVERAGDEGLMTTGRRLVYILEGMSVGRNQHRALEVFAAVQEGLREGAWDATRAAQLIEQFQKNLVLTEDVDKAMESIFATSGVTQGAVAERGDVVIIGGVRVPRK